jgi:uncharacterized protein (TIGR04222 family)
VGQFVVAFAVVFALAIAIPASVRWLIRGAPAGLAVPELSPYEAGYLAGGRQRVAEVLIVFLIGSGTLRVEYDGDLNAADWTGGPQAGLLREILTAGTPGGMSAFEACRRLRSRPTIAMTARDARRRQLVVSASRLAAFRLVTAAAVVALLVAGIAGITGVDLHNGPTWLATLLFLVTATTDLVLLGNLRRPVVTRFGASNLKRLRGALPAGRLAPSRSAGWDAPTGLDGTALLQVALWGFRAVPDAATREALLAGMRTEIADRWRGERARKRRERPEGRSR